MVVVGEGGTALQAEYLLLVRFRETEVHVLMGELEHNLAGHGVGFRVEETLVGGNGVEETAVGMDGERLLGPCHCHIVAAQHVVGGMLRVGDEHENMVELMSLCLVDGVYHHIGIRHVAEVFHRRLEHKVPEVAVILGAVGLLEELYAPHQIGQTLAQGILGVGLGPRRLPSLVVDHRRLGAVGMIQTFEEIPCLRQVPESQSVHRLHQFAVDSLFVEQGE